jgi:hypothetical protein
MGYSILILLAGCSWGPSPVNNPQKHYPERIPAQIKSESDHLGRLQEELQRELEQTSAPPVTRSRCCRPMTLLKIKPSPSRWSTSPLQTVLYSLSQAVGVNIILDPMVSDEQRSITLNFEMQRLPRY